MDRPRAQIEIPDYSYVLILIGLKGIGTELVGYPVLGFKDIPIPVFHDLSGVRLGRHLLILGIGG
jgi:hypothetical protein